MATFYTDPTILKSMRKKWKKRATDEPFRTWKKKKVPVKTGMEEADKLWDKSGAQKIAAQTPKEKRKRRQRRFHMLRSKAV
jgi:ribonuclease HI